MASLAQLLGLRDVGVDAGVEPRLELLAQGLGDLRARGWPAARSILAAAAERARRDAGGRRRSGARLVPLPAESRRTRSRRERGRRRRGAPAAPCGRREPWERRDAVAGAIAMSCEGDAQPRRSASERVDR